MIKEGKMRETILIAACLDKDRRNKLTRALLPLRIRLKEISKEDYGKPIGFFAGIKELDPEELAWNGEELSSELLVMAGLSSQRVDQVLRAIRKSGLSIPYKAVLTASNQGWNGWELFQEIKKEHQQMNEGRSPGTA